MSVRERLDLDGLPLNSDSFREYLTGFSPSLWLPLGASSGLTDLSGNGYNGTANGGLTVGGGAGMLTGVSDTSTDFAGGYISTTYTTRRNLAFDPLIELATATYWRTDSTLTAPTKTTEWPSGRQSGKWTKTAFASGSYLGGSHYTGAGKWLVTVGDVITLSVNFKNAGNQSLEARVTFRTSGGAGVGAVVVTPLAVGYEGRKTCLAGVTVPATAVSVDITAANSSGAPYTGTLYWAESLLEVAATAGEFFPTFAQLASGEAGWLGTAHASASDKGAFANGTVRGMGAPLRVDSLAAVRGLIGSATNGLWVNTDGSLNLRIAGTDVTGNAGDLTAGTAAFVWVEFDEPNNTVRFYVNGALVDTVTGVTAQWAAETLDVGRARGIYQDGLMQHVAVVEGALTAAQIQALYEVGAEGQYTIQGLNIGPPSKRLTWLARNEGDALGDVPGYERRTVTAKIRVPGATDKDEALDRLGRLVEKLQLAEQVEGGIDAIWQPAGGTFTGTLKVLAAEITELPIEMTGDNAGWFIEHPVAGIRLDCKPFLYGTEVTTSTTTNTNPMQEFTISALAGDVPAEGRLIVSDAATQARDHLEWGVESGTTAQTSTDLLLDSDDLTITGYAGTGTTRSGAYDPGGAGNSVIRGTTSPNWVALCSTGNQSHVGSYRIKARVYSTTADASVRLAWRAGDEAHTSNPAAVPPLVNQWVEVDLGTIRIPTVVLGTQRWEGRVEFKADTAGATFDLDVLYLIPAERYGKARAPLTLVTPTVFSARDEFDQTAGALAGKTAPTGGTWAGAGDADDFTVETTGKTASRAANSDSAITNGRFATLPVALTDVSVQGRVKWGYDSSAVVARYGLLLRYTNTSNYLLAAFDHPAGGSYTATLFKAVAGVVTTLTAGAESYGYGAFHDLRVDVSAAGEWAFYVNGIQIGRGSDTVLATGGTLATGAVGIYDAKAFASTPSTTRNYDELSAGALPTDAVIFSGQSVEFSHQDTLREDSTGTYWGRPAVYRGSRFFIPNAGDAANVARIVVKARRSDVDFFADDQIADSTSVAVAYTPRYLAVPRS